ncbi:diguanylate cyclase domain-containing protein [Ruminococcus flavefaciens]|uniref:sensor domain-containing diguanylate cyclase n=1 Tax=Ruminococcus flavefaciens TaxID=1265 RepID=UPI001565C6F2|nr:diguanylate cyclase [Ruminococcus flavefaciens]
MKPRQRLFSHSLRTEITFTMLCVILASLVVTTLLSAVFIRTTESHKSDRLLQMLCASGQRSLDYYFDSVQNSVTKVTTFAEEDLDSVNSEEELAAHIERIREYFCMTASKTKGVLTYYYRIDPSVSSEINGFWYIDLNGQGFEEHEVTDITQYDVEDTSKLVWFTVPKHEGKPIWLPPYITDNLDVRVISYDAPVYWKGQFIGVIGIEVDYSTMAEEINSIRLYDNGYAFLGDADGNLFYHPHIDVADLSSGSEFEFPYREGDENKVIRYAYRGEKKEAVWCTLSNGLRLSITVPVSETQGEWKGLILNISLGAVVVLIAASLFLMYYTRRITKPLEQLTAAAEQIERGNYDLDLIYDEDDELGRLTRSFKDLSGTMKAHITDLHGQVFIDALTKVKNKGALSNRLDEMQEAIDSGAQEQAFAIGVFDCDQLKLINDRYGHDKGDIYLKKAAHIICEVFKHSPVFRMGGDEFAVILENEDYMDRDALLEQFDKTAETVNEAAAEPWEEVHISKGFAVFAPSEDSAVTDVMQRADQLMYENKRERKKQRKQ